MKARSSAARAVPALSALSGAVILGGLLVFLWYASYHSAVVSNFNLSIFERVDALSWDSVSLHHHLVRLATLVTGAIQPAPYVLLAAVPVIISLWRRRPAVALAIAGSIAGSIASAEVLKPLLGSALPGGPINPGSFPSGHVTAATVLSLCMLLAVPRWLRPFVALAGAALVAAVASGVVLLGWHYPSDAVGGVLVASAWWLLGIAAIEFAAMRKPRLDADALAA